MTITAQTVVVGVDGAGPGLEAVRWAAKVASRRRLTVLIAHAFESPQMIAYGGGMAAPLPVLDVLESEGRKVLAEAVAAARAIDPALTVETTMPTDWAARMLVDLSRQARLLVVGASGRGAFPAMLLGSTATAVVSHSDCPVAVIRGRVGTTSRPDTGPVVVGVDGSPAGEPAIGVAFEEASMRGTELVAVHAWSDVSFDDAYSSHRMLLRDWATMAEDESRVLAERLAGWQEKCPDVEVRRLVVRDRPRHALLDWSTRAQLVVVGNRGRGGFAGLLLGSTGRALAQHAQCPVVIVRFGRKR